MLCSAQNQHCILFVNASLDHWYVVVTHIHKDNMTYAINAILCELWHRCQCWVVIVSICALRTFWCYGNTGWSFLETWQLLMPPIAFYISVVGCVLGAKQRVINTNISLFEMSTRKSIVMILFMYLLSILKYFSRPLTTYRVLVSRFNGFRIIWCVCFGVISHWRS